MHMGCSVRIVKRPKAFAISGDAIFYRFFVSPLATTGRMTKILKGETQAKRSGEVNIVCGYRSSRYA